MDNSFSQLVLDQVNTPLNLDHTLGCGQVFRWEKKDNYWYGVVDGTVIKLRQDHDGIMYKTFPKDRGEDFIRRYLRLDDELPLILSKIDRDAAIGRAVGALYGLRIVRQEPWECLVSYICATFSNIPRIKGMIQNISKKFGKEILFENDLFYTFPDVKTLAKITLRELSDCGLGFRARYILETSKMIKDQTINLNALNRLTYDAAKRQLLNLAGVGPKVADCVLLFSADQLEAFPVDVWMRRTISEHYGKHFRKDVREGNISSRSYEQVNRFGREYFGEFAGYAQEYLYHYYRLHREG